MKVAQPAADIGRFAQRLVEIFQVKDACAGAFDEIERGAGGVAGGLDFAGFAAEAFGKAPCPDR